MATFSGQATVAMRVAADSAPGPIRHIMRAEVSASGFPNPATGAANSDVVASSHQPFEMVGGESIRIALGFDVSTAINTPSGGDMQGWIELLVENEPDASLVRSVRVIDNALLASAATYQTGEITFYATSDGTAAGSPRSGTYRLRVVMWYGQRTNDGTFGGYRVNSDGAIVRTGTTNLWATSVAVQDRGYIRASTTATLTPSLLTWAYGETPTLTVDLAATALMALPLTLVAGPDSGSSNTVTDGHVRTITVGDQFPAAATLYEPSITVPNSVLSGIPWTVLTVTGDDVIVDPRITAEHHLQVDANDYATPPDEHTGVKANLDRLTAELGFVGFRMVNAKGAGLNGLTVTETLTDANNLVGTVINRSVVTATKGGEAGWSPNFTGASWDESLPGGNWAHVLDITAPANADANTHLVDGSVNYVLLAPNPNYRVLVGGGPYEASNPQGDKDHWHPGDPLLVGLALIDQSAGGVKLLTPDASPVPRVILGRFNQAFGRAEYYASDETWKAAGGGAIVDTWPLVASPGDPQTFIWQFSGIDTEEWTWADLFLIGLCSYNGTPYSGPATVPVLSDANGHQGYALDAVGLALSGAIGFK